MRRTDAAAMIDDLRAHLAAARARNAELVAALRDYLAGTVASAEGTGTTANLYAEMHGLADAMMEHAGGHRVIDKRADVAKRLRALAEKYRHADIPQMILGQVRDALAARGDEDIIALARNTHNAAILSEQKADLAEADRDRLAAQLAEARAEELERQREEMARTWVPLDARGIRDGDQCERCGGAGVYLYASTATWRGGIGGAAMTHDVCNRCWGSGSASRPWRSWRTPAAAERVAAMEAVCEVLRAFVELRDHGPKGRSYVEALVDVTNRGRAALARLDAAGGGK